MVSPIYEFCQKSANDQPADLQNGIWQKPAQKAEQQHDQRDWQTYASEDGSSSSPPHATDLLPADWWQDGRKNSQATDSAPLDDATAQAVFGHWAEPGLQSHGIGAPASVVAAAQAGPDDRARPGPQPGSLSIETADDLDTTESPEDVWSPFQHALPESAAGMENAQAGFLGANQAVPHQAQLQAAFGPTQDLSKISAFVGGNADRAAAAFSARAYAIGNRIGFRSAPDLHLAAHEAAHVALGHSGVRLRSDVDGSSDADERRADEVADRVVRGESAADLLPSADGEPEPDGTGTPEQTDSNANQPAPEQPLPDDQPIGSTEPPAGSLTPTADEDGSLPEPAETPDGTRGGPHDATEPKPISQRATSKGANPSQEALSPLEQEQATAIRGRGLNYDIWISEAEDLLELVSEADLQEFDRLVGQKIAGQALQLRSKIYDEVCAFNMALRALIALPDGQTDPGVRQVRDAQRRLHSAAVDYRNFLRVNSIEQKIRCDKAIGTEKAHGLIAGWEILGLQLKLAGLRNDIKKVDAELSEIERLIEANKSSILPLKAGALMVAKTAGSIALGFLKKWKKSLDIIITIGEVLLSEDRPKEVAKESITETFAQVNEFSALSAGYNEATAKKIGDYSSQILDFLSDFSENWEEFTKDLNKIHHTNQKLHETFRRFLKSRNLLIDKMQDYHTEIQQVMKRYGQTFDGAKTECAGVEGSYEEKRSRVQVPGVDN